jgi:type II secretory pathway pseudopilin PulG
MKTPGTNAFTFVEIVIVMAIAAILIGLAIPTGSVIRVKGEQTAALSNVKEIVQACKLFAMDNNGDYPTYAIDPVTLEPSVNAGRISPAGGSNGAFAELFPDYVTNERLFCEEGSAFTPTLADNIIDVPPRVTPLRTLEAGENTFAYCVGLTNKSPAQFPLVADGFADARKWTYSKDRTAKGGVREGKEAVVGLVDGSASSMKVDQASMTVLHNPADPAASYFSTAVKGTEPWLAAPENVWLNPL